MVRKAGLTVIPGDPETDPRTAIRSLFSSSSSFTMVTENLAAGACDCNCLAGMVTVAVVMFTFWKSEPDVAVVCVPPPTVMVTVVLVARAIEPWKLAVTSTFAVLASSFTEFGSIDSWIWVGAASSSTTSTVVPTTV